MGTSATIGTITFMGTRVAAPSGKFPDDSSETGLASEPHLKVHKLVNIQKIKVLPASQEIAQKIYALES